MKPAPDPDLAQQRKVVDAFLAASQAGDFDALVAVLDPDVVFRVDRGALAPGAGTGGHRRRRGGGAGAVARLPLARFARPAVVNGAAGVVVAPTGKALAVVGFTVVRGRIVEIDVVANPDKLRGLSSLD